MDQSNLRDHKAIGIEQELFFTNDIAPGAVFWMPKGMAIFRELERYIRRLTDEGGYQEVSTPIMVKTDLFKQSGHWDKFGDQNMYNMLIKDDEKDAGTLYTLKPMNCPEATIIYRARPRSYRELPLRFSEIGRLHRKEKSGEVNGLLRVRQITMDDAHIFTQEENILSEINKILDIMIDFYSSLGFEPDFRLATRPEKFAGTEENWTKAEKDLEEALKSKNLKYSIKDQDGAFYGPKIDVHIKDSLGRDWQLATVQVDFHMPEAFDLSYIDNEGKKQRPVMIHRAIFGSFERFLGVLTEHFQGVFPLWLSPIQVAVIPVKENHVSEAEKIVKKLKDSGIRAETGNKFENLSEAIKVYSLQKVPYLAIIGDREIEKNEVSVRQRSSKVAATMSLDDFIKQVLKEIEEKV